MAGLYDFKKIKSSGGREKKERKGERIRESEGGGERGTMVWLKDGDVPPDKERCVRNDGKQWRCSKRRDGRAAMCEYHVQYSRRKSRTAAMKRKVEPRVRVPGKNLRAWTRKDGSSSEEEVRFFFLCSGFGVFF